MQSEVEAKERTIRALEAQLAALTETVATQAFEIEQLTKRNEQAVEAKSTVERFGREERREHQSQMSETRQRIIELEG